MTGPFNAFHDMIGITNFLETSQDCLLLCIVTQVKCVHYPGLPSHPSHAVAKAQMNGFGGMVSFEVKGGREEAIRVVEV